MKFNDVTGHYSNEELEKRENIKENYIKQNEKVQDLPKLPIGLIDDVSKEHYQLLHKEGSKLVGINSLDTELLVRMANIKSKIMKLEKQVDEEGLLITTFTKQSGEKIEPHPAVLLIDKLTRTYNSCLQLSGLDLKSRSKSIIKSSDENDFDLEEFVNSEEYKNFTPWWVEKESK